MKTRPTRESHRSLRSESGSTITLVCAFVAFMLVTMIALLTVGGQDAALVVRDIRAARALYIAESGLESAQAWLHAQSAPPESTAQFYPLGQGAHTIAGGHYSVSISPDPDNPDNSRKIYTVTSMGSSGSSTRILEEVLAKRSWAEFFYLTRHEHLPGNGGPCWFVTGDFLDGPMHSNDQIHIFGDPVFGGTVTSSHNLFMYYNGHPSNHVESAAAGNPPHDNPTFQEGYELGADELNVPNNLNDLRAAAQDGGIALSGNYEVVIGREDDAGDPMYGYVSYRKNKNWTDVLIESFNGIIYVNGGVSVSGVLDGELTVSTNGNLDIAADVTYLASNENGPLPDCDDVLGLVAGSNIIVLDNEPNCDDCEIHAHMIALDGCFEVQSWGSGPPRGALTVYGGIVQKMRGPVGRVQVIGDELVTVSGYDKDYHYDRRLLEIEPPGYEHIPLDGEMKYIRLAWREIMCG